MAERRRLKPGPKPAKGKAIAKHGEGKEWQFRFDKTAETEPLHDLFRCRSPGELESWFGVRLDEDLEWGHAMRDIIRNILVTIARGSLRAKTEERKGGFTDESKKGGISSDNGISP